MATQFVEGRFRGENAAGAPLSGGRLYTYAVGTTTHQATYTDYTLATQNTYVNDGAGGLYIALDSRGECSVWLGAGLTYTFALKDSTGASIWTDDGIKAKADAATTADTATTATTATKATNLAAGGAGRVPYQSATDTTGFTAAGTTGQVLVSGGTGVPTWTSAPDFTTQSAGNNTTKASTTAFVATAITNALANITSSTYTPTQNVAGSTNVTTFVASTFQYLRVGNVLTVSGELVITPTAAATTVVAFTLPVSTALGLAYTLGGTFEEWSALGSAVSIHGAVTLDPSRNVATLYYTAPDTAARAFFVHFTYRIA